MTLITNLKRCLSSDPEHIPDIEYDYNDEIFNAKKPKTKKTSHVIEFMGEYKTIFEFNAQEYQLIRNISHENLSQMFWMKFRWPLGRISAQEELALNNQKSIIFNVPLMSIPEDLKHPITQIPLLIMELMKFLSRRECLGTIGAFRIDALASKTLQNESLVSSGIEADNFSIECMTNFGKMSLLKRFFRSIPGSLINKSITSLMNQISMQCDDINVLSKMIRWLLTCIPLANYKALACLCLLLHKYAKHEESNLMSAVSLAICWSPIIFEVEADVLIIKNITKLLTLFITKWDKFFMLSI